MDEQHTADPEADVGEATESILVRETGLLPSELGTRRRDVLHTLAAREKGVAIISLRLARISRTFTECQGSERPDDLAALQSGGRLQIG